MEKHKLQVKIGAGLLALILSYFVWQNSSASIQNMVRSTDEQLKEALMGDTPHVFYCIAGHKGEENLPGIFTELNAGE